MNPTPSDVAAFLLRRPHEDLVETLRHLEELVNDKSAPPAVDLIKRVFSAEVINEKWCGDLTEIPTDEGKLYLATVLDLASRRMPGFAIGEHHDAPLARAALCMAATVRGGQVAGVVFHSDKGGESQEQEGRRP